MVRQRLRFFCRNKGNRCGNGVARKYVPTLFCEAAAVAKYFALTLHYCTIAAVAQCEHIQRQHNENNNKKNRIRCRTM